MKKTILLLFAFVAFSSSLIAQSNLEKRIKANVDAYIERVEKNTTLTKEEKTKLFELKKEHTEKFWKLSEELKDKPELQEERQKLNIAYGKNVMEKFGKERGKEILIAARPKKED